MSVRRDPTKYRQQNYKERKKAERKRKETQEKIYIHPTKKLTDNVCMRGNIVTICYYIIRE